jgi:hypothetical protein
MSPTTPSTPKLQGYRRLGVWLAVLLLLLTAAVLLFKPQRQPTPTPSTTAVPAPSATVPAPSQPSLTALPPALQALEAAWQRRLREQTDPVLGKQASFTVSQHQHRQWTLTVAEALYSEASPTPANANDTPTGEAPTTLTPQQGKAYLKTINGQLFNQQGQPVATFSAPYGEYDQSQQYLKLEGGVKVLAHRQAAPSAGAAALPRANSADALSVMAPTLLWRGDQPKLLATGGVVVSLGSLGQSTAREARFSMDMSEIELRGQAVSTLSASL